MENKQYFVSVLTPTFNRSEKLIRMLRSLERQTYKDFKVIIFNDASTDNTIEALNEFKKSSSLDIDVIDSKEKRYKHGAINVLFNECSTPYAFQLDDDDELVPNAIENALNLFTTLPNKEDYCALVGRCIDTSTNKMCGPLFPEDINIRGWSKAIKMARKVGGEKFSLLNMNIYKKYKFPEPKGVTFISEALFWRSVLNNYQEYYTNEIFRIYHTNEGDCLSNQKKSNQYFKNVYYYYVSFLNGLKDKYTRYKNERFKTIIQLSLIYFKTDKSFKKKYKLKGILNNFLLFLCFPFMILGRIKYR